LFEKKWGFNPSSPKDKISWIKSRYSANHIIWSIGKKSYEWDYLK